MRNRDAFELTIDRSDYARRTRISWRSRMFEVDRSLELRDGWDADPRRLAHFIERLIGDTLIAWAELRANGREMAQALMPLWEVEVHREMERMEYEARSGRDPRARMEMLYGYTTINPNLWFGAPPEDPKAKQKARELLMRNLDVGQEKSFKKDGSFRVTAKDGKVYTISTARSFNVKADDGTKYCGQLADAPVEDQMLAQKLLLEHEPEKFFKNANVSPAPIASGASNMTATEISMRQQEYMMFRPNNINWFTP